MSVRSPDEVDAALEGGADIVDAKDPFAGPLGALAPDLLGRVLARVPAGTPFSAALGDPPDGPAAARLIETLALGPRPAPAYVKLGFAGVRTPLAAESMLRTAVGAAGAHPARPLVVAVAYADRPDDALHIDAIASLAAAAGAAGVLLDTMSKGRGTLVDAVDPVRLRAWSAGVRAAGLFVALAGSLDEPDIPWAVRFSPAIIGVRGAACTGGRGGTVSVPKVRALRSAIRLTAEHDRPVAEHQTDALPAAATHVVTHS